MTAELAAHLVARGIVAAGTDIDATELSGGVSSKVVAVTSAARGLVVKRALAQLRVEQEWRADPRRTVIEGEAMRVAAELVPGRVPAVIDLDASTNTLVMQRAPATMTNWRDDLLAGRIDPAIAHTLGETLGALHAGTRAMTPRLERLRDKALFDALRLAPFHDAIAARHPGAAPVIRAVRDRLAQASICLVHGDFSPKNVLAGARGDVWVLDWEVAHVGDPGFDVAYLLTHLLLKSIHREADRAAYARLATDFLAAYGRRAGEWVALNVGCLALARVDGKSPATYLTAEQRARTREVALRVLHDPPADVVEIWRL